MKTVSLDSVRKRINHQFAKNNQQLHKSTKGKIESLGQYYVVDRALGTVANHHVNIAELAIQCNVLKADEQLQTIIHEGRADVTDLVKAKTLGLLPPAHAEDEELATA